MIKWIPCKKKHSHLSLNSSAFRKKVRSLIVTLKLCKVDNNIIKTLLVKVTKGTSLIISIIVLSTYLLCSSFMVCRGSCKMALLHSVGWSLFQHWIIKPIRVWLVRTKECSEVYYFFFFFFWLKVTQWKFKFFFCNSFRTNQY